MRYFFGLPKLRITLPRLLSTFMLAWSYACGDATDISDMAAKIEAARAERTAQGGDAAQGPFVRPHFMLRIDTTSAAPMPGDAPRTMTTERGRVWTRMSHDTPTPAAETPAEVAQPEVHIGTPQAKNADDVLVSPAFSFGGRAAEVHEVTAVAHRGQLQPKPAGTVTARFFVQDMSRHALLQLVRLAGIYHAALSELFSGENTDAAPEGPAAAFMQDLATQTPEDAAQLAQGYGRHHAESRRVALDLTGLADVNRFVDMGWLSATLNSDLLLLYVDSCYALLKMAHIAGVPADPAAFVAPDPAAGPKEFIAAVEAVRPDLAERLRVWQKAPRARAFAQIGSASAPEEQRAAQPDADARPDADGRPDADAKSGTRKSLEIETEPGPQGGRGTRIRVVVDVLPSGGGAETAND